MRNITVKLFGESGKENVTFIHSYEAIIGCSCVEHQCSPYKLTLPKGSYVIECFGASGTDILNDFSMGAHTSGSIHINKKQDFFLYIGEQGKFNDTSTYNGGGKGNEHSYAGGGATDIRLKYGDYNSFESLKSRIMVAGGGGGHCTFHNNIHEGGKGNAGGLEGEDGATYSTPEVYCLTIAEGGNQTNGGKGGTSPNETDNPKYEQSPNQDGKFGIGGSSIYGSGGGGGGYFGGGAGKTDYKQSASGAGGSSYISGHYGCLSILENADKDNPITTDSPNHYSNLVFTDTYMSSWTSNDRNFGNGYAKITFFIDPINQTCSNRLNQNCIVALTYIFIVLDK